MDLVEDALLLLDAHVKSPPPFGNKSSVQAVESQDRRGHSTDRLAFTTGRRMRGVLILRTIEAVVDSPGTRAPLDEKLDTSDLKAPPKKTSVETLNN